MRTHMQAHGYLPLLLSLLLAALPGVIVAYGLYPETMQRCVNELWHEGCVLFMGSPSVTSEGEIRGRSSSTSSQSRHRSTSPARHASPSPSPPKKHTTIAVAENNDSASAGASASSSSRRKSTSATATSTARESKTPKPDRHSMLPSAPTTGVKNDRKSISKSNGKSVRAQATEKEEDEEEERLRIAAEMDVYRGTRSKTPMKRK